MFIFSSILPDFTVQLSRVPEKFNKVFKFVKQKNLNIHEIVLKKKAL